MWKHITIIPGYCYNDKQWHNIDLCIGERKVKQVFKHNYRWFTPVHISIAMMVGDHFGRGSTLPSITLHCWLIVIHAAREIDTGQNKVGHDVHVCLSLSCMVNFNGICLPEYCLYNVIVVFVLFLSKGALYPTERGVLSYPWGKNARI